MKLIHFNKFQTANLDSVEINCFHAAEVKDIVSTFQQQQ
tara:strand:- start:1937 stop:2053 length:117 start_codon:yes stop_codon:yes gene_type:complete